MYVDPTTYLRNQYINNRFGATEDDWPPYQPKHYTTLALIHHEDCTDVGVISVTQELATRGDISTLPSVDSNTETHTKATKSVSDIFAFMTPSSSPSMLLVEGAPGIGKTVLAKEIAFQWATNKLLNSIKFLLLVFLRNFHSGNVKSVEGFMLHIFRNGKVANDIGDYLFKTNGKDLAIVFDGYDEISERDRTDSFVADIIKRAVFPECLLVITSRPTASSHLRSIVNCRVEVVGFTEEDRLAYIKAAIPDSHEKIEALQVYLQSNPTINALCYIPLNMTILLCLGIKDIKNLPKTQTELYKRFIDMTVIRFLQKQGINCNTLSISELPHPHKEVFEELSRFAFKALKNDQLVFTLAELKANCPNLTSSNLNGLGLLKSAKYFDYNNSREEVTCHFLHFSIQEYMAADYISKLSGNEQIRLLKSTFWTIRYYNTWIMYVGITGGNSFELKHFFSGNRFRVFTRRSKSPHISKKLTSDKVKCLHMFQCLAETSNVDMIASVGQCFRNQEIDLSNQTLLPSHLNTLGFFLIRSVCKRWKSLNLSKCNIGDAGCDILSTWFIGEGTRYLVSIEHVDVSYNQFDYFSLVKSFAIFKSWCTSEIIITDNAISDSTTSSKLYAAIENTFIQSELITNGNKGALKLAIIGSFLFAHRLKQTDLFRIFFSQLHSIKSIYLLNIIYDKNFLEIQPLKSRISKLKNIHCLGTVLNANFIKATNMALAEKNDTDFNITSLFIYDSSLKDASEIYSLIKGSSSMPGVFLIISKSKIQGVINTCSLTDELSDLEILNLVKTMRLFCYNSLPSASFWRDNLQFYGNSSEAIIQSFVDFLYKITTTYYLTICLVEGSTLIAHNVGYETINKIDTSLLATAVYLSNCNLNTVEYKKITTKSNVFKVSIINGTLAFKVCTNLLRNCLYLQELFLHKVDTLTLNELTLLIRFKWKFSTVLIIKDELILHNPTNTQLTLALQLEPSVTKWKFINCQLNPDVYHQLVTMLTTTSVKQTSLEIDLINSDIGNIECEVLLEHITNSSSSVRKLNISFGKLTSSMLPVLVNIIFAWNVQELVICYRESTILCCLIKLIKEKFFIRRYHDETTLSVVYGRCFIYTVEIEKVTM